VAGVAGTLAQFLLDAQQLVVLGYSLARAGAPVLICPTPVATVSWRASDMAHWRLCCW